MDVAEDRDVVVKLLAQAGELGATALDETLVGDIRADDDVAADEVGAYERGDGHGLQTGVAQKVHAHRQRGLTAHLSDDGAHGGDRDGRHGLTEERSVADVLDDEAGETGVLEDLGLLKGDLDNVVEAQLAPRRPGQRRQMDHADEGLALEEVGHR